MNREEQVFSLSQLSAIVAGVFRMHFSGERYWVTAEVIGLKVSRGHCYLQLAEKDELGSNPKAEFRGIIWAGLFNILHPRFTRETGTPLREQMQVLLQVEVQYHERYGLSLIVHDIDATYTLGRMELERRKTLERLRREGLLERNRSLPLPVSLQRIAVISAEDSKGYQDFISTLQGNPYGYSFHITLFSALLQGDLAAADIIRQLGKIASRSAAYDAVCIVRGGGGASSLECFNEYSLAAEIARHPLPLITGIGHMANRSVCDEVAHTARITPTDVASFIIDQQAALEAALEECWENIRLIAGECLSTEKEEMANSAQRLVSDTRLRLAREQRLLDQEAFGLRHLLQQKVSGENTRLFQLPVRVRSAVLRYREREESLLLSALRKTGSIAERILERNQTLLSDREARIRLLDPAQVLRRGYSYTLLNNKVLTDPADAKEGDEIKTILSKGEIISTVSSKKNG